MNDTLNIQEHRPAGSTSSNLKNLWVLFRKMVEYNLKIVFANKFIWFLLSAVVFFLAMAVVYIVSNDTSNMADFYGIFVFCGMLFIFYPTVFGIQNDQDAKTIEILFGIPNYRYKVWLVRIIMMFVIASLMMLVFTWLGSILIIRFDFVTMAFQAMMPVIFIGMLAFMLSTIIRSGNGTAVVLIIVSMIFFFAGDAMYRTPWNIFHTPFNPPYNVTEAAWAVVTFKNRIILACGSVLFLLTALLNLQRREKFM